MNASSPNRRVGSVLLGLLLAAGAAPVRADTGGEAEIAFQGSYLGDGASRLTDVTGVAAKFRTFLPGLGFLTGGSSSPTGRGRPLRS